MKNSNDTRDLPACGDGLPQPTAPPRAPHFNRAKHILVSLLLPPPPLNLDSKSKLRWSWLSERPYLLASIQNLVSQHFEHHVLPLRPSSTWGVPWQLDGSLRCEKSQDFWTTHLQIIHFLQFYACTICTRQIQEFIYTKDKILVPIASQTQRTSIAFIDLLNLAAYKNTTDWTPTAKA